MCLGISPYTFYLIFGFIFNCCRASFSLVGLTKNRMEMFHELVNIFHFASASVCLLIEMLAIAPHISRLITMVLHSIEIVLSILCMVVRMLQKRRKRQKRKKAARVEAEKNDDNTKPDSTSQTQNVAVNVSVTPLGAGKRKSPVATTTATVEGEFTKKDVQPVCSEVAGTTIPERAKSFEEIRALVEEQMAPKRMKFYDNPVYEGPSTRPRSYQPMSTVYEIPQYRQHRRASSVSNMDIQKAIYGKPKLSWRRRHQIEASDEQRQQQQQQQLPMAEMGEIQQQRPSTSL